MKFIIILIIIFLGIGGLFMVSQNKGQTNNTPSLTIKIIEKDIANGGQLIDVRTTSEFASGHIAGAVNVPLQNLQSGYTLPSAKDKPVYVYCKSGNRSNQAAAILKAAGYQNIIDLGAITHVQSLGGIIKT